MESTEIDGIARRNAELTNRLVPLTDILPRLCREDTRSNWKIEGSKFLEEALEVGRGAILLTGHLGYPKLITPILRSNGYDARSVVAKSMVSIERQLRLERRLAQRGLARVPLLRALNRDAYERSCIAAQLDVRPILSALQENKPVMVAGDGLKAAEFVRLSFLGGMYPFAKGFMKIAMVTRTAVLPTFALEGENGHWIVLRIGEPLNVDPSASVESNLMKFAQILEEQIHQTPYLWYRWAARRSLEQIPQLPEGKWVDRWNRGVRGGNRLEDA